MTQTPTQERLATVKRIGSEVAAKHASDVDAKARFPSEALQALKEQKLLSVLVPKSLGGDEVGMVELAAMCELLGQHCASSAMVFAMHQIQVACLARHGASARYFQT